jgi:hypothetical protein
MINSVMRQIRPTSEPPEEIVREIMGFFVILNKDPARGLTSRHRNITKFLSYINLGSTLGDGVQRLKFVYILNVLKPKLCAVVTHFSAKMHSTIRIFFNLKPKIEPQAFTASSTISIVQNLRFLRIKTGFVKSFANFLTIALRENLGALFVLFVSSMNS